MEQFKIVYSPEKEEYIVEHGSFNLGYIGCFPKDTIEIRFDPEYIENYNGYIKEGMSSNETAEGLTRFYTERKLALEKHQRELNNYFLAHIFQDLIDCNYPFWEESNDSLAQFIIEAKMPDADQSEWEDLIFSSEVVKKVADAAAANFETPNNGTISKPDMEAVIKEAFPMIDLNKLVAAIYPEYLVFEEDNIIFQCSSNDCGKMLICAAYAEICSDNSFYDWHNH